jgi:uncharacterized protein YndB with AHSA1/START domain
MTNVTRANRAIHLAVQIDATPEDVWRALTDPAELTRWFPLEASVTPGVGGRVRWSWGEPIVAESSIESWEPPKRLVLVEQVMLGDHVSPGEKASAAGRVMEFTLERRQGQTVLRLVHSGFGSDADWERELHDGVLRGWTFELRSLKHYLEGHQGEDRRVVWVHQPFTEPLEQAWNTLFSSKAFLAAGAIDGLAEGSHYRIKAVTGDLFEGRVLVHVPGVQFSATVANMNNGILRIELEHVGNNRDVTVWLSTYGVKEPEVKSFGRRWAEVISALFPVPGTLKTEP